MPNPLAQASKTSPIALGVLGVGYAVALGLHLSLPEKHPTVVGGLNAFSLLFVLALVIERALQPFTPVLGPDTEDAKRRLREAEAQVRFNAAQQAGPAIIAVDTAGAPPAASEEDARKVAEARAAVDKSREKTGLMLWAFASVLGFLLSAGTSVGILDVILVKDEPPFWLDMAITGMAIGAGTKPINDLWTRLQNKPTG